MPARRRLSPRQFYRSLHRIADGRVGSFERAFLEELQRHAATIDDARLLRALQRAWSALEAARQRTGKATPSKEAVEGIIGALGIDDTLAPRIRARYQSLTQQTLGLAGEAMSEAMPVCFAFARGCCQCAIVRDTAPTLRGIIGLSPDQAASVGRFRSEWLPDMNARVLDDRELLTKHK